MPARTAESAQGQFHNADMPRRLIFIALLTSMLMQAISLGVPLVNTPGGQAAAHALWHWVGLQHHHHRAPELSAEELAGFEAFGDLGIPASAFVAADTYHRDQSPDSTQHLLMDGCLLGMAMIPSWPPASGADVLHPAAPSARVEAAPAKPFIEGLRRPPRPMA